MAETITKLYGPKLQEHYADLYCCLRKPLPLWWGMNQTRLNVVKTLSNSPKVIEGF